MVGKIIASVLTTVVSGLIWIKSYTSTPTRLYPVESSVSVPDERYIKRKRRKEKQPEVKVETKPEPKFTPQPLKNLPKAPKWKHPRQTITGWEKGQMRSRCTNTRKLGC